MENLKSQIKVIGIAGSYGKTTMKEVLKEVLAAKFSVMATPESVNTPLGIARWILSEVNSATEIIVVEMGEHYRGDIAKLCRLTAPDVSVVTGINEAHLERMKKMETIVETVFEIVSGTKPGGLVVINGDDKRVMEHYKEYVWPDHVVEKFKMDDLDNKKFNPESLQWEAVLDGVGNITIGLLAPYACGVVSAAAKVSQSFGMSPEEIKKGIQGILPVEHRLQPIRSSGDVLVIDDSYNGNPDGVREAINVLSQFSGRRKVYITPGLVETGSQSQEIHNKIGAQLAEVVNVVILIKNSVTPWVEEGIFSANGKAQDASPEIIWFGTAQEAHAGLKNILKPGDVVLFQNDWGDQYL